MGGCQNYGPFLGPQYYTAPSIEGTQKGTIILITTHIHQNDIVVPFSTHTNIPENDIGHYLGRPHSSWGRPIDYTEYTRVIIDKRSGLLFSKMVCNWYILSQGVCYGLVTVVMSSWGYDTSEWMVIVARNRNHGSRRRSRNRLEMLVYVYIHSPYMCINIYCICIDTYIYMCICISRRTFEYTPIVQGFA